MGFLDELKKAQQGNSSIYGAVAPDNDNHIADILSARQSMQRDDLNTFKNKANFMSDLSLRQNRMKSIYDLEGASQPPANGLFGMNNGMTSNNGQPMNTVLREDPDHITPFQREGLSIRKDDNAIDRSRVEQQGRLGSERLSIQDAQQKLNQQKSDQIKLQKENELAAKIVDSEGRLAFAQKRLEQNANDTAARMELIKAKQDADAAKFELVSHQKDKQQEELNNYRAAQLAGKNRPIESETTTEVNPDGTKKTVKTRKGPISEEEDNSNDPLGIR